MQLTGSNKIRIGVIGVGHLGEYHVQKYTRMPNVELVGVVDTNRKRADEIASRYGARAFDNRYELLKMVDGVSLAAPTDNHFEIGRDCLARGVHVLVEKPITFEVEHAETLIEMAKERNLILQVGHIERFNPAVVKMQSLLSRPTFIESHRLHLFTVRGTDVDVVLDLMIHDLDIILHVIPAQIRELHAVGMTVVTGKTDIANARIIFEDGTVANLTANRISNETVRKIRIFQPDAYISVDCAKRELSVTQLENTTKNAENFPHIASNKMRYPDSDPLDEQIRSFVDSIANGLDPVVTGGDGKRALVAARAIISQIESGCKNFEAIC